VSDVDRDIDLGGSGLGNLGDHVFGGGIDNIPAFGRLAAAELAIQQNSMTLMVKFG
jgi:hypothetical protein